MSFTAHKKRGPGKPRFYISEKRQTRKPGSVLHGQQVTLRFRHFSGPFVAKRLKQPTHTVFPKPETETGSFICCNLQTGAYLVFQHPGFTPHNCRQLRRALLPHVFTLTCIHVCGRYSFLRHFPLPKPLRFESLPVRKRVALCCPDFPPFFCSKPQKNSDGAVCLRQR